MKKFILSFLVYIIGVSPVFAQTYQELSDHAIACTEQDSLAQAENYIRQALKLEPANPHNALLFSNLGTIQRRQRDYDQALESYTYALNIAPRAVPILLNRAALNLEMGRNEQARVDYSLVLDLEKDNREALPAYIVLSDKVLHLLSTARPITMEAFGNISGIGEYKKKKYGKDFVELIKKYV